MYKLNFTPGPWEVRKELDGYWYDTLTQIYAPERPIYKRFVAKTTTQTRVCAVTTEEAEANAKLISVVPDMWAVLQRFASKDDYWECIDDIETMTRKLGLTK